MCSSKRPAPAPVEVEKPVFVRNPYLDDDDSSGTQIARLGTSSLSIPLETGIGFTGRLGQGGASGSGLPKGNARRSGSAPNLAIRPRPRVPGSITGPTPRVGGPTEARPYQPQPYQPNYQQD